MIELLEQAEVLPAGSVAVAKKVVVELSATVTDKPGEEKVATEPMAATPEVQVEFVYRRTVEPASAEPNIKGVLSLAGEAGFVDVNIGAAGAAESST